MQLYRLGTMRDKKEALSRLGVEPGGVHIISKKMELYYFMIKDLRTPAANILKQDALSIGAELAVPAGVITCEQPVYDCILIGNRKQIEILAQKERAQPFGLKQLAEALGTFLHTPEFPTQIMGIINANEDSFYAGSRFMEAEAIEEIEQMITKGAEIIDVGAVSSRPGAAPVDEETELARIKPICDLIHARRLHQKALFSIDSTTPSVITYALERGFGLINDISGARNEEIIRLAVEYQASLCIMHMQGTPQTMQQNPFYEDVILEVSGFFEERIARCEALGLPMSQIILDVGIGFGKRLEDNLTLLKHLRHFAKFGCALLVGASRKSMIDQLIPTPVEERLPGTLAIHLKALEEGAHIIRCHDVAAHRQAIEVLKHIN